MNLNVWSHLVQSYDIPSTCILSTCRSIWRVALLSVTLSFVLPQTVQVKMLPFREIMDHKVALRSSAEPPLKDIWAGELLVVITVVVLLGTFCALCSFVPISIFSVVVLLY